MAPPRRLPNQFRIVAGHWRGRRLRFPSLPGIRPSPERIRETLFNWLRERVAGARCLDLFAGSGALGLEALSRGAREVVFVDRERRAAAAIRDHLAALGAPAESARVACRDALSFLDGKPEAFDLVFLDPPFDGGLVQPCLARLRGGWLVPDSRVYVEARAVPATLPAGLQVLRVTRAGQVHGTLLGPAGGAEDF